MSFSYGRTRDCAFARVSGYSGGECESTVALAQIYVPHWNVCAHVAHIV